MRNFIQTIAQVEMMNTMKAIELFGLKVITAAYNKGRISFDGDFIVFVQ